MTRNQIDYWKNVETERHNRELEAQGLKQIELERERNRITASQAAETVRSNMAREYETHRSNVANEQNQVLRTGIEAERVGEIARSNLVYENIAKTNAKANVISANAASKQANVAERNASTRVSEHKETVRSNMSNEDIRANQNPWVSLATTVQKIVPRVADYVSTVVSDLKSIKAPTIKTSVKSPVSNYLGGR